MCGFVGISSTSQIIQREWLAAGRDAMTHRGPDNGGEWWSTDRCVGLAHRRLSIIDLSSSGHQPMSDISGSLRLVFNGEIYNYLDLRAELLSKGIIFRTRTDTEVIIAAYQVWGIDCITRFNGMFAFALYDAKEKIVFIARDRAGEKPLFYRHTKNDFRFSSELKAMLMDPELSRKIDNDALDCYLGFGYVPGNRCILQGFHKLPPAHAARYDLKSGEIKVWQYWQLPELDSSVVKGEVDEASLLNELEILLQDAVRRQLVADVPVGVLLSGGVDSSLVTAMAVRASNKVKTFTIRFPGHGKLDETEHARTIAQHFDTEHVELEAKPISANLLPRLVRQFDEPMADSSMIPMLLVSELVREHCVVALGGDGGDELFGGYGSYTRLLLMNYYLGRIPHSLRKLVSRSAEYLMPVGVKGRNWLLGFGGQMHNGLPLIASIFDATSRRQLMAQRADWCLSADSILKSRVPHHSELLQRATRMDYSNYLAEDILVKVDRASMLSSLEIRAPMLDYRLIEFAFSKVPTHLKATHRDKKILLKKLAARMLPPQFDRQREQGFSIPLADWLKQGPYRKLFNDVLLDSGSMFDQRMVCGLLKGQDRGRANSERLFSLVLFELWRREYGATC